MTWPPLTHINILYLYCTVRNLILFIWYIYYLLTLLLVIFSFLANLGFPKCVVIALIFFLSFKLSSWRRSFFLWLTRDLTIYYTPNTLRPPLKSLSLGCCIDLAKNFFGPPFPKHKKKTPTHPQMLRCLLLFPDVSLCVYLKSHLTLTFTLLHSRFTLRSFIFSLWIESTHGILCYFPPSPVPLLFSQFGGNVFGHNVRARRVNNTLGLNLQFLDNWGLS